MSLGQGTAHLLKDMDPRDRHRAVAFDQLV